MIVRPRPGVFVKGRFARSGTPDEIAAVGSIQQGGPEEQLLLPEAVRNKETMVIHTECAIYNANVKTKREADQVSLRGDLFEVMLVSDWTREGGFYEVICVRLGQ